VTVNSSRDEIQALTLQAFSLLNQMREQSGGRPTLSADDLLLFCYRLRDGYRIVQSTSDRFRGATFGFLNDLLYQLESRPEETLQSPEWSTLIESFLRDLASGKFTLARSAGR
jgi:hypothetical protein